ncbi:MAG TPA: dihydrolipoamide acetyltransferase family protein [Actinomycetota bacterium]|nr:dihydrolipoamide acetyltransferase family protein [Actinomycetota bacterium]
MAEHVFTLPDLGEGLDDGTIVAWLVTEGDVVALNQPLVEVETAKAAVEIPSPVAGTVARLHGEVDGVVAVGAPLVTFELGDAAPPTPRTDGKDANDVSDASTPVAATERSSVGAAGTVAATPVVRKLAKDLGVDLRVIDGTGPGGRITADDVHAAADRPSAGAEDAVTRVPVTATRRAIAENLERQWSIPQVTTFRTVDCTELEAFRGEVEASSLAVVVSALASIVPSHPLINAAWGGDAILLSSDVHVGLAADTERGLVVPVLRDAGPRGIAGVAAEIRRLADGARAGALRPGELDGATVAVSNTGSYGSEAGTPILSPGTAVTLAFGVIAPRALVVDGEVRARPAATISLTFDHRVLDGAAAGRALTDLVHLLQSPTRLRDLPR